MFASARRSSASSIRIGRIVTVIPHPQPLSVARRLLLTSRSCGDGEGRNYDKQKRLILIGTRRGNALRGTTRVDATSDGNDRFVRCNHTGTAISGGSRPRLLRPSTP